MTALPADSAVPQADGSQVAAALDTARAAIADARFDEARDSLLGLLGGTLSDAQAVDARYTLAVARRYARDLAGALDTLDELLAAAPRHARAWQERGHACLTLNCPTDAAFAYGKAVELNPGLAASWAALAGLHERDGDTRKARFARTQADYLAVLPRELAGVIDLTHDGNLYKAETLCRQYLRRHPRDVEAMRLLADIGMRLKVYDDAEFLLESCVQFAPGNVRARSDYLKVLNRKGKHAAAYEQACTLHRAQPGNPAYRVAVANALTGIGRFDEGIAQYRQCLADEGANKAGICVLLGHALKASGQRDAAVSSYRDAYRYRADYGDAYWSLANTKTYRFTDDELQRMTAHEATADVDPDDRIHLCFAAGKAYEDRDDCDTSFAYYERGNRLARQRSAYDPARTERMVQAQIDTCTRDLFEAKSQVGHDCPDPIFIVGLPRSGSTLLEQILASHSMVDGTLELHDLLGLAQRLGGRSAAGDSDYPRVLQTLDDDYFRRFGEQYIENTRVYRGSAPRFTDKMPNNFMHLGLLRLVLPKAKVIDARRHPLACCVSGFKQLFGEGQDFTYGLESIGRYYRSYVRLMDHWDDVLPGFVLRVMHEDVVDDLEGQVRRLLDFCGLPFEADCLQFHRTERTVRTPSSEQVRQPIYRSGLAQWRRFEQHLAPLRQALGPELLARYPA